MESIRERIDDLMWRYWYEGKRVFRVLAVAVAILLALRGTASCASRAGAA